jgi:hypothetical protein
MNYLINNKFIIAISAAVGSMFLTILIQYILNKRSRFRYYVWHNNVGFSTADSVFGSVKILWNDTSVPNLFLSTVELINESIKDYENVVVRIFTTDSHLLTEKTEIVGSTYFPKWTKEYIDKLYVEPDKTPSDEQIELYRKQRDYFITTINRGQVIRFIFLNSAKTQKKPTIWIDILHKGIKLDFRVAPTKIFNVSQPIASVVGATIGIIVICVIIIYTNSVSLAAILSFVYGLFAILPGVIIIKLWRKIKQLLVG